MKKVETSYANNKDYEESLYCIYDDDTNIVLQIFTANADNQAWFKFKSFLLGVPESLRDNFSLYVFAKVNTSDLSVSSQIVRRVEKVSEVKDGE